jgi:Glycosyl hydrolases family 18
MKYLYIVVLCVVFGLIDETVRADWPARVFAPYMYVGSGDNFRLTSCDDACGQKYFTLAFIITDKLGNPAWDGRIPMENNFYADQITALRARGGDVIVSFGGEAGTELALADKDATSLEAQYQSIINRYRLTWLDFDIEGKALTNTAANQRRNSVLVDLQTKNPGLIISYTLPVDPDGLDQNSLRLLTDAVAKGLKVYEVNIMTMDFGPHFSRGRLMSDVAIASTLKAHQQCQNISPTLEIGITPMIGRNDEKTEIFTPNDANVLEKWATSMPWVCGLSFWSVNRDAGMPGMKNNNTHSGIQQQPWEFTNIFKPFTSP